MEMRASAATVSYDRRFIVGGFPDEIGSRTDFLDIACLQLGQTPSTIEDLVDPFPFEADLPTRLAEDEAAVSHSPDRGLYGFGRKIRQMGIDVRIA